MSVPIYHMAGARKEMEALIAREREEEGRAVAGEIGNISSIGSWWNGEEFGRIEDNFAYSIQEILEERYGKDKPKKKGGE